METKYNGEVNINVYKEFLVKRIFKLLPLREEKKNWEKYLCGLMVELAGMSALVDDIDYITLSAKLEGLVTVAEDVDAFKKTVFDCIHLAKRIKED
jgi:hypothetical protein